MFSISYNLVNNAKYISFIKTYPRQQLKIGYIYTILRFFNLQLEQPTRGDWAATCLQDLKDLQIEESLSDIKLMTKNKFSKLLRERSKSKALKYLTEKESKGEGYEI